MVLYAGSRETAACVRVAAWCLHGSGACPPPLPDDPPARLRRHDRLSIASRRVPRRSSPEALDKGEPARSVKLDDEQASAMECDGTE